MKSSGLILCAIILSACSPSDKEQARDEAHQTMEQAKHDSKVILRDAEIGAQKASRELNHDLEKTREKVRKALNEPADGSKDANTDKDRH